MENRVYMKIKGHVFKCLPSQTKLVQSRRENTTFYSKEKPMFVINTFETAIINEQPWACDVQKMWGKLPNKRRTVRIVMVTETEATEWVFKDVEITFISGIFDKNFTERNGFARPLIPVIKGSTYHVVKTIVHTHAWWQK